jgi:hypothetical protein
MPSQRIESQQLPQNQRTAGIRRLVKRGVPSEAPISTIFGAEKSI